MSSQMRRSGGASSAASEMHWKAYRLLEKGKDASYREAIPLLRELAVLEKADKAWAEYHLGLVFDYGYGARRNRALAIYWYAKAARRGFDSAQLNLGIILANARGSLRNEKRAVALYKRAASQGNRNAAYNLGMYYGEGRGVRKSTSASRKWYGVAARLGDADAQSVLSGKRGHGRPRRKAAPRRPRRQG